MEKGVNVLIGVDVAVAVGVCVEAGVGVCVGVAPRSQATKNVVSKNETMKVINLFRFVLIC
jgi:hypothetical protein